MISMLPLYSSVLCKDSLCIQMHPVVLSEGSLFIDGFLFQGLRRKRHGVCNSIRWTGSHRGAKFSLLGLVNSNEKTNARFGINKRAKKYHDLYTLLRASSEHINNDKVHSTNVLESDSEIVSQRDNHGLKVTVSEQKNKTHKQLSSLDSYFSKLHSRRDEKQSIAIAPDQPEFAAISSMEVQPNPNKSASTMIPAESQSTKEEKPIERKADLKTLDSYLEEHNAGSRDSPKDDVDDAIPEINKSGKTTNSSTTEEDEFTIELLKLMNLLEKELEYDKQEKASKLIEKKKDVFDGLLPSYDGSYNCCLINTLVAVNIAVYLFELASPVRSSDVGSVSLPLLYGAKINELILDGEWWRFITPMFLHSGLLHVAFSSWALLTFAPLVDRAYGSFAFCMIYFLGGVCGNLMSFFHTPDATIGGTGPVFAIIGSWVVYLFQNREAIGDDIADSMMQKVVFASVLSVALSFLTPIDDWTHLGAACAGLIFGALVCPALPVSAASKKLLSDPADESQERFFLSGQSADPNKLFTVFALFLATLLSLFFVLAPIITESQLSNISESF